MDIVRAWLALIVVAVLFLAIAAIPLVAWLAQSFERAIRLRIDIVRAFPPPSDCRTDLPPLLAAYVAKTGMDDVQQTRWTRIEQQGEMRLAPDDKWMPLTATQYSAAASPDFIWRASVKMAPGVSAVVIDGLVEWQGILEARLFGGIPVAKASGVDTLKGELQRYLAELPWNPTAIACNPAIEWQELDAHRVAAEVTFGDLSTRVVLHFDEAGDIVQATATDRPRGMGTKTIPTPWGGDFGDYRVVNGLRIPAQAVVWWDLPEGRFDYWRGEVTEVWQQLGVDEAPLPTEESGGE